MTGARAIPSLLLLLAACGGTVVFEEDGGEGGAGSGASGPGGTSSTSGTSTGPGTSSVASGTGGASTSSGVVSSANAGGSSPTSGVTTSSGGIDCGGLDYADCLAFEGQCVPVFDDFCCSSCFPGECADCVSYQFVACVPFAPGGPKEPCGPAPCGLIPDWACRGEEPRCENGCFAEPGCVEKLFCEGKGCGVECGPIAPDACGPAECNGLPPDCFEGSFPEVANGCWTGACIPAWVCLPPPL